MPLKGAGSSAAKSVYFFGAGAAEGTRDMKKVLGGKGANLAEMTNLGIPVPPGFTIACDVSVRFLREGRYPPELEGEVADRSAAALDLHRGARPGVRERVEGVEDAVADAAADDVVPRVVGPARLLRVEDHAARRELDDRRRGPVRALERDLPDPRR